MTTYSHKVGLYQEAIVSYEVVTADGNVITVTDSNEHSDLFYCLPWSHGTLGFLVGLTLRIVKVKPYVHMEYIPVGDRHIFFDSNTINSSATHKMSTAKKSWNSLEQLTKTRKLLIIWK